MVVVEQPVETMSTTDEDSILVDFNDIQNSSSSSSNNDANTTSSYQLQLQQQQQQQYMYIQQLLQEIEHLRGELDRLSRQHEAEIRGLREQVKNLQDELMNKNSELEQQKIVSSHYLGIMVGDNCWQISYFVSEKRKSWGKAKNHYGEREGQGRSGKPRK